jgi:hypothetical protein
VQQQRHFREERCAPAWFRFSRKRQWQAENGWHERDVPLQSARRTGRARRPKATDSRDGGSADFVGGDDRDQESQEQQDRRLHEHNLNSGSPREVCPKSQIISR